MTDIGLGCDKDEKVLEPLPLVICNNSLIVLHMSLDALFLDSSSVLGDTVVPRGKLTSKLKSQSSPQLNVRFV